MDIKKYRRYGILLTAILSLTLASGCSAGSSAPAGSAASASAEGTEAADAKGGSLAIIAVETDDTTSTSAATYVTAVTYRLNGTEETVTAKKGVLTLVVNGAQEDIAAGMTFEAVETFSFTDTTVEHSGSGAPPWDRESLLAAYQFRQALYVTGAGIQEQASVTDAISGSYDETGATDVTLISNGGFFNGIYIRDAAFDINGLRMNMTGDGGDDFSGWGAGVMADGTAHVTLDNAIIETIGVIRTAVWAGEESNLTVKNSVITAKETLDTQEEYENLVVPMMKRTPFALGMEGTVRATNVLGAAAAVFSDSIIVSTGWGALSTDSGVAYADNSNRYALTVKDSLAGIGTVEVAQSGKDYTLTKEVSGIIYGFIMGGSGYVTYADSGVWNQYDNVQFYSPDYVEIMASGQSSSFFENAELYSGRIAFMTQQNAGGTLSLRNSSIYAADTLMQIKSGAANNGYTDFIIDDCEVKLGDDNPWSGVLLELVESDDAGNPGVTTYQINDLGETATRASSRGDITASNAVFKNGTYTGNIWNNIYNYTQSLNVTLDSATIRGAISASYGYHADHEGNRLENGTLLSACTYPNYLDQTNGTNGDYLHIGAYVNVAAPVVNNPLNLTVTNGSRWQAEGVNHYLAALVLDDLDNVRSDADTTVYVQSLTVGGRNYEDGTYENGQVTFVVEAVEEIDTNSDTLANTQDYSGLHSVVFKAVDEDKAPMSKGVAFAYKAFTNITFQANARDGYEIVSVICSDASALTENGDGSYVIDNLTEAENTVTIIVRAAKTPAGAPGEPPT